MRVTPVLTIVVIVLAALAGTALATALALLWPDRYVTRPGWPTYYLGISALVRDAPVAGAAAPPLYAGSLGTTRVAAQSELTMLLAPGQSEAAWQAQQDYVRALGFVPMRTPAAEPASPAWRNAAFLAPRGGGIVLLTLDPVGDGGVGAQLNLLHLR